LDDFDPDFDPAEIFLFLIFGGLLTISFVAATNSDSAEVDLKSKTLAGIVRTKHEFASVEPSDQVLKFDEKGQDIKNKKLALYDLRHNLNVFPFLSINQLLM
jgi:hypothetical protein